METNEIPDIVIEIRKKFGAVGLSHLVNNVSSTFVVLPLDRMANLFLTRKRLS